ncbi:MAG TPA: MATE family efflux transporter [Kofleriaceae bacterium]
MTERRALIALAVPLAAQQVGNQLMATVDAAMLGRYSEAALAGAGVANNLLFAITSIGIGIVMGMDTVVPQALGAKRIDDARRAVGAGIRLSILVGLMATLVVFAMPLLMRMVKVQPEILAEATPYIYIRALGIVPILITVALRSFLAAHHKTRPLVVGMIVGNLANLVFDYLLIFPAGMGVLGAAVATSFVQIVTVAIYLASARSIYPTPAPASTSEDLRTVVRYGAPVGGQIFAEVGIFGVATMIAAHLGEREAAAHAIALGIVSMTFSFAMGIAAATSVQVGNAVGAREWALARSRGFLGMRVGLVVMACFAIALVFIPNALVRVFTDDAPVIAAAAPLLAIAALFQLFDGTQAIAAGALRGLGHTSATLYGNLVGHYMVALPVILILAFTLDLGIVGVWWGLSLGLTVTAGYLVLMFIRGCKRLPEEHPPTPC